MNLPSLIGLLLLGGGLSWLSGRFHPSAPRWLATLTLLVAGAMVLGFWLEPQHAAVYSGIQRAMD